MLKHPAFAARPTLGQFAKNGVWETAWSFLPGASPADEAVAAYLGEASEVAFEAFFGEAFFGLRRTGTAEQVQACALACVSALRQATDGADFFARLSKGYALDGLGQHTTFAEIGAVNAWRSVGAFRIEQPADARRDFEQLWSALQDTPLARNATHRKAIEFAGALPLPHWFALPVSASEPPFALSRERLLEALRPVHTTDAHANRP